MSKLQKTLKLEFEPVATLWLETPVEGALSFKEGKRGCLMSLFAAAAKGKVAAINNATVGCPGGGVGLGYGNHYANAFPGGQDCFCHFLSCGNSGYPKGAQIAEQMQGHAPQAFVDEYLHGERYMKGPEIVEDFINNVGIRELNETYTVFMPLSQVAELAEEPVTVSLVCNAAQLSALTILCNYFRPGLENVAIPYVAGCQSIGAMTYNEIDKDNQRGIVGLVDITARKTVQHSLGTDKMTFSMPYALYQQMEENVAGSFLEKSPWLDLC